MLKKISVTIISFTLLSLLPLNFSYASNPISSPAPTTWPAISLALVALGIPVGKTELEIKRSQCISKELVLGLTASKVISQTIGQSLTQSERTQVLSATRLLTPANSVEGVNVSLKCQMAYFIEKGEVAKVFPVSTGRKGLETPRGIFKASWRVDRWYDSLAFPGTMLYRPIFFYKGDALHGLASDSSVLPYPDSHGCIRVKKADVDYIWKHFVTTLDRIRVY